MPALSKVKDSARQVVENPDQGRARMAKRGQTELITPRHWQVRATAWISSGVISRPLPAKGDWYRGIGWRAGEE